MLAVLLLWISAALADDTPAFLAWAAAQPDLEPAPGIADRVGDYRFQHVIFDDIAIAAQREPERVTVERFGTSAGGRPLWAFHVLDPSAPVQRKVLVFAGIHALEWISSEVATNLLLELIDDPELGTEVTVIPLLNPDGRARVETDFVKGRVHDYWRGNQRNVDLNRDFPVYRDARAIWRKLIPAYYATSPGPLSQPESRALDALAARECYARAASLHSFGGFLYFPWTGRFARPADWRSFVLLGRAMERAQGPFAYKTRELSRWGFFFRAQGTEIDDLYGRYGTRAFLVELTRSGITRPRDLKTPFRWYNPRNRMRHVEQGLEAMRVLVRHPPVPGEPERFTCAPALPSPRP